MLTKRKSYCNFEKLVWTFRLKIEESKLFATGKIKKPLTFEVKNEESA